MHTGEPDEAPRQTPAAEISWVETERLLAHFAEQNPALWARRGRRGGPARGAPDPLRPAAAAAERAGRLLSSELSGVPRGPAHRARQRKTGDRGHRCPCGRPRVAPDPAVSVRRSALQQGPRVGARPARASARRPGPRRGQGQPGAGGVHRRGARAVPGQALSDPRGSGRELPPAQPGRHRGRDRGAGPADARPVPGPAGRPAHLRSARSPRLRRGAGRDLSLWREKGRTVEIAAPFWIGRYPVTNSQYQAFIDDGGYSERKWWSDAGWGWLQKKGSPSPSSGATGAGMAPTSRWSASASGRPRPAAPGRAGACRGNRNGRPPPAARRAVSTPGAATGRTGSATPTRPGLACTSPVGLFPRSRQAQLELHDLAGNVCEWCERHGPKRRPRPFPRGARRVLDERRDDAQCALAALRHHPDDRRRPTSVFVWCVRPPSKVTDL